MAKATRRLGADGSARPTTAAAAALSPRTLLVFSLALLLYAVSVTFQLVAVHRMDGGPRHPAARALDAAAPPRRPHPHNHNDGNGAAPSSDAGADSKKPVVAYVVTLTGCGDDKRYSRAAAIGLVTQGAAVLRHSIELAHAESKYGFRMYALVHPEAEACADAVGKLDYALVVRDTPFDAAKIRGKFLREHIDGASCCGRKEFIKLYAYKLVDHPVAVVLDLDSLVLKPLDDLFDALLAEEYDWAGSSLPVHDKKNAKDLPKKIDAFYTKDYNMVTPGRGAYAGVQGGFLMIRPDKTAFEEYIDIVLEGDYREGEGWGGKYGYFFGGMQVQGICAYFYGERHPDAGVELDRCRVNSMVDNPLFRHDESKKRGGECRDGRAECEDCRTTDLKEVVSAHFTICQKPWECKYHWDSESQELCSGLHGEWFRIRRSFEESRAEDDALRSLPDLEGAYKPEVYYGYCRRGKGYLPIKI